MQSLPAPHRDQYEKRGAVIEKTPAIHSQSRTVGRSQTAPIPSRRNIVGGHRRPYNKRCKLIRYATLDSQFFRANYFLTNSFSPAAAVSYTHLRAHETP